MNLSVRVGIISLGNLKPKYAGHTKNPNNDDDE